MQRLLTLLFGAFSSGFCLCWWLFVKQSTSIDVRTHTCLLCNCGMQPVHLLKRRLCRNTAQKIIGCLLPSLEEIANSRHLSRASVIISDCTHPGHHLFDLLPSGRRYRTLRARTDSKIVSFLQPTSTATHFRASFLILPFYCTVSIYYCISSDVWMHER